MTRRRKALPVLFVLLWLGGWTSLPGKETLSWWPFDEGGGRRVVDRASLAEDEIRGNFRFVKGIVGSGLKFDGYTTAVVRPARDTPSLGGTFTIEAWIALAAYPWNSCPILSREKDGNGYAFEIGPRGELVFRIASGGHPTECVSSGRLPLRSWTHVAAVFAPGAGVRLYIDGRPSGGTASAESPEPGRDADLVIGSLQRPLRPSHAVGRGEGTLPSWFSLDAILDELKIHARALSETELRGTFEERTPLPAPELPARIMPSGPPGPGRFGAHYARLEYCWEWDDLWRAGDHPDVVVRFDGSPVRVVFWRGLRYSPAWVTENGLWMADQSAESGNLEGCVEHMQDVHCEQSHVRILESSPARAVVHWRYAPVSSLGNLWTAEGRTGWAWWVDETYTFYPDGTGVRKIEWRDPEPSQRFPWLQLQETSVLCHPGQEAEDVLDRAAITLLNLAGERRTYGWPDDGTPDTRRRRNLPVDPSIVRKIEPENPGIQVVHYRSAYKPFIVFEPGSKHTVYVGRVRDKLRNFPAYNHWPVNQTRSDGRFAQAADRASSFSIAYASPVVHREENRNRVNSLYGMTGRPPESLIPLAKSWARAPRLRPVEGGLASSGYDMSERAYRLKADGSGRRVALVLEAKPESPLVNACLVIENWGDADARVTVDGADAASGKARLGRVGTLEGTDLVVWIEKTSTSPVRIVIEPRVS